MATGQGRQTSRRKPPVRQRPADPEGGLAVPEIDFYKAVVDSLEKEHEPLVRMALAKAKERALAAQNEMALKVYGDALEQERARARELEAKLAQYEQGQEESGGEVTPLRPADVKSKEATE